MKLQNLIQMTAMLATFTLIGCGSGSNTGSGNRAGTAGSDSNNASALSHAASIVSAPAVFNYSQIARPGDIVYIQGANVVGSTVSFTSSGSGTVTLPVLNSYADTYGTSEISVQIPSTATNALTMTLSNSAGTSAVLYLNRATPFHMDAVSYAPGSAFKIFGRNLYLSGITPLVYFQSASGVTYNATLNLAASNENMLVGTIPTNVPVGTPAIYVVNGNGSGGYPLVEATFQGISIISGSSVDPFSLGVGWASGFASFADNVIVPSNLVQNGSDNTLAIQTAINQANAAGGGVVSIPAGTYAISGSLNHLSNVVIKGAGIGRTVLNYSTAAPNYPIYGNTDDLVGLMDLTFMTATTTTAPNYILSSRIFFKNVQIEVSNNSTYPTGFGDVTLNFYQNTNCLITGSSFTNSGFNGASGIYAVRNNGFVFTGNSVQFAGGSAIGTDGSQNMYLANNNFVWNVQYQNATPYVTTHGVTVNFDLGITVDSNNWSILNGPANNPVRYDGEALLSEGGGPQRTEESSTVTTATASTLSDTTPNDMMINNFDNSFLFYGNTSTAMNYSVVIVSGTGVGQKRRINSYTENQIAVWPAWTVIPDSTSNYATFVSGLENAILRNNEFTGWPIGTELYDSGSDNVDIVGNTYSSGGGIYLLSCDCGLATFTGTINGVKNATTTYRRFDPIQNVNIVGNMVTNPGGIWPAYIGNVVAVGELPPFGFGSIGVTIKNNSVQSNYPSLGYDNNQNNVNEGYFNNMQVDVTGSYGTNHIPAAIGSIFQGNTCINCTSYAVVSGTNVVASDYVGFNLVNPYQLTASKLLFQKWVWPSPDTGQGSVNDFISGTTITQ